MREAPKKMKQTSPISGVDDIGEVPLSGYVVGELCVIVLDVKRGSWKFCDEDIVRQSTEPQPWRIRQLVKSLDEGTSRREVEAVNLPQQFVRRRIDESYALVVVARAYRTGPLSITSSYSVAHRELHLCTPLGAGYRMHSHWTTP